MSRYTLIASFFVVLSFCYFYFISLNENSLKIEWVRFPGGVFFSTFGDPEFTMKAHEIPNGKVRRISAGTFELMKTEATNAMYNECVAAQQCIPHQNGKANSDDPKMASFPVTNIQWQQAETFCRWAGGRLPTADEWEFAAQGGGKHDWKYPWGNTHPECARAVVDERPNSPFGNGCGSGINSVCSHPLGNTEQGLCDISGNVWEWMQDGVLLTRHGLESSHSPRLQSKFIGRVLKGGGLGSDTDYSIPARVWHSYDFAYSALGVRCARDIY